MRKLDLFDNFKRIVAPDRKTCCRPLANSVDCQDCSLLKRRGIKSRHRMRLVMLGEQYVAREVEKFLNLFFGLQFPAKPQRAGCRKRLSAARGICHVRLDDSLELEHRLVVEHDMIEITTCDACFGKAVIGGVFRQTRVVFFAREPLFLGGGDDLAVFN